MGARIKELRSAHGFKQQYIADQVGVELRTYQNWQAGKTPPAQENLERLADLFEVTTTFILRGEEPQGSDVLARLEHIEEAVAGLVERQDRMLNIMDDLTPTRIADVLAGVLASEAAEAQGSSRARKLAREARRRPAA